MPDINPRESNPQTKKSSNTTYQQNHKTFGDRLWVWLINGRILFDRRYIDRIPTATSQ